MHTNKVIVFTYGIWDNFRHEDTMLQSHRLLSFSHPPLPPHFRFLVLTHTCVLWRGALLYHLFSLCCEAMMALTVKSLFCISRDGCMVSTLGSVPELCCTHWSVYVALAFHLQTEANYAWNMILLICFLSSIFKYFNYDFHVCVYQGHESVSSSSVSFSYCYIFVDFRH